MNVPTWKQKLAVELKRDKKRTTILAILVIVGGIVVGRLVVKQSAPSKAGAAVGAAKAPVHQVNPGGSALPATFVNLPSAAPRTPWVPGKRSFTRDIFTPNVEFFPPAQEKKTTSVTVEKRVDPNEIRKAMENVIRSQARTLVLESTFLGDVPSAIINSRMLRVGEWISGFQVVEISSKTCLLRKNDVKVTLRMKN